MLIRYHIFYFALGCILSVLTLYFHLIFSLLLIFYLIWLYYRFDYRIVMMCCFFCALMFIPQIHVENLSENISGTIIKTSEKHCYVETEIGIIKLYHEEDFHYKDTIECSIKALELNENTNDHAFNEKLYLYSQQIYYKAQMVELKSKQSHSSLYGYIESRLSSKQDVQDYQRLFLFGERSEDIQEDYQQLSQLSLVHLFALSGMHIHILLFLLKRSFSLFFNEKVTQWISFLIIGIYVFSIPTQVSLYRAFFVLLLYELLKKWFHQLDILSLLVIVYLFINPYIIYNISFVFSYFVYFIVLITKRLKYSTILIYLSTIPIVLNLNYQLSFMTLLVSTIMVPFIELFYSVSILSCIFPVLEEVLCVCIDILKVILSLLNDFDSFFIFSKPSFSFVIMYYILFFIMIYRLSYHKKIMKIVLVLCSLMISFSLYSTYKIYGEITMIDVGQGDCTLIRLPMNQGNILVDTGGNKDYDLATKTIIPYLKSIGIHKLDYVYISHGDYDHCGALESLKKHFKINHIIDSYEEYRKIGGMEVTMLNTQTYYSDINDQSLVMKMDLDDFSLLMTGDISTEVEKELRDVYCSIDVDILKVSHHGSKTGSSVDLFELIKPSVAMIGVKKNNLYKHPSNEVIERLKRKSITILRTDEDGMFHIRFYDKSRYIFR